MEELTNEEISKLDKILTFLNDNKAYSFEKSYLAKKINISIEEYEFLYNKIVEFSINEFPIGNILDRDKTYRSIVCDYSTTRFLEKGGFKKHFTTKHENESLIQKVPEQNINANNVIINNGTTKSITQKNIPEKKVRWDIIGIIGLILTTLTFLFGDNIYDKITKGNTDSKQTESKLFLEYYKKINLPYLESTPILDKGLYIQQHYSEFIFGGPNINKIKINARKENGEKIEFKKSDEGSIVLEIFEKPYIEFCYKNEFYFMQISTKDMAHSFNCTIKKIKEPTLNLIEVEKL